MIEALVYVLIVLLWTGLLCLGGWVCILAWFEWEGGLPRIAGVLGGLVLIVGCFTVGVFAITQEDDSGPCIREETGYVMVGKILTPYTYCTERGKWEKQ